MRVDGAWTRPAGVKVHRIQKVQKVQRVVVAAAPQFLKSALRDWLYESYSLIRITMMSHLRWLPPLGALQHHLSPAVSVGRQKESAFMGRLGALLRPTCTSYAGCAQWIIKL